MQNFNPDGLPAKPIFLFIKPPKSLPLPCGKLTLWSILKVVWNPGLNTDGILAFLFSYIPRYPFSLTYSDTIFPKAKEMI